MELPRKDWEIYAILRTVGPVKARQVLSRRKLEQRYHERQRATMPRRWVLIMGDHDSAVEKVLIPRHLSDEEWKRVCDYVWIDAPRSPFDCTGRWFSSRLARFEVPAGTWVYHWIACDV